MPGPGGHHGGPGGPGGHRGPGGPGVGGPRPPMGGCPPMGHRPPPPPMGGGMGHRPMGRRGCCGCLLPVIGIFAGVVAVIAFLV